MKTLALLLCCFIAISSTPWQPDFEKANQLAKEKHQLILLNFSGSDWCGPCMRMRKEIFESDAFVKMADTTLVLLNADFPRTKKNQLSQDKIKQNEQLADKYNSEGKFPYTVLIDSKGKVINSWDGLPDENAEQFSKRVKSICDANK